MVGVGDEQIGAAEIAVSEAGMMECEQCLRDILKELWWGHALGGVVAFAQQCLPAIDVFHDDCVFAE